MTGNGNGNLVRLLPTGLLHTQGKYCQAWSGAGIHQLLDNATHYLNQVNANIGVDSTKDLNEFPSSESDKTPFVMGLYQFHKSNFI